MAILKISKRFSLGMNTTLEETLEKLVGNEMGIFVIDCFAKPLVPYTPTESKKEGRKKQLMNCETPRYSSSSSFVTIFIISYGSSHHHPSLESLGNRWHFQSHRLEADRRLELRWNGSPPYFVQYFIHRLFCFRQFTHADRRIYALLDINRNP